MGYSMNMKDEKEPTKKRLLEEGWHKFKIIGCEPSVSKKGNKMFIFKLEDDKTKYVDTIYLVGEEGKRWMLKSLLAVCGVPASADGVYDWDENMVIGKEIGGLVDHEENSYINRNGDEVKGKQHRIVEFKPVNETIGWDD